MEDNRHLFFRFLAQTSDSPMAIEPIRAEGMYVYDVRGNKYLDLISGISVCNLGHSHPAIVQAVKDQAEKYMHLMVYGEFIQSPQVQLASLLASVLPPELDNVYLVNSGSEAVDGALKLAKRYTGKQGIVSFQQAYHGSSHGALSVTGNESIKRSFRPLLPGISFLPYNDIPSLERITSGTACVIIEPVQGEAGVIVPSRQFMKALRLRCTETGTLLIADEIQTGFGRTGNLFAFMDLDIVPDILLLAKGLGGGMPIGAFVSSHEIMKVLTWSPVLGHITTFGGHPVSCAAAHAMLKVLLETRIWETVKEKEKLFRKYLVHPAIKEIRSAGLLIALELGDADRVKQVIKRCFSEGLITDWFLFRDTALRIAPPLIITGEQIRQAAQIIVRALNESMQPSARQTILPPSGHP
jgi:acetylornithine/N-succinyldiaminopimelate aminotransferase